MRVDLSGWASDRTLESLIYNATSPFEAPTTGHFTTEPLSVQQVAFNGVCDHTAALILADLEADILPLDAVDAVFDDDEWIRRMAELTRLEKEQPKAPLRAEKLRDRFPWATQVPISPPAKSEALKCLEAINAVYFAHEHLLSAGITHPASTSGEEQSANHLWFLADSAVSRSMRRGLLAHRRGTIALVATYPWTAPRFQHFKHVREMLRLTTSCYREYLGVLANYPEAQVTLVPPDGTMEPPRALDPLTPFREALRRDGGVGVVDPA